MFTKLGDLWVADSHLGTFRKHGLTGLDALLSYEPTESLPKPGLPSWRERFRMELCGESGETFAFYAKRYRAPPFSAQRGRIVHGAPRRSTAWIEWDWLRRLAADGIATMTPVAFGERMAGWRERGSVLVTEAVGGESLERWAARRKERCSREWIVSLASFISRFHHLGYAHRDLYLSHVFFENTGDEGVRFRLIDLQRVIRPRWRRKRWVIKDLAALNYSTPSPVATAADRVRFLKAYLGVQRLGLTQKRLAGRIAAKTRRIADHDRRRGEACHR